MDTLEKVKLSLGITTGEQDPVLLLMIDDAEAAVRDYCNRKNCPPALEYVVRELVTDSFNYNNEGNVTSVKRGDTEISYANVISKGSFTDRQRAAMNRYRLMKIC